MNRIIIFNEKKYNFYETLQTFYKNKYSNFNSFENIHNLLQDLAENDKKYYDEIPIFGYSDRNSVFVKDFYNFIDSDYSFLYSYLDFIQNEIKPLFPNEIKLIVQKTPNIRFHIPKWSENKNTHICLFKYKQKNLLIEQMLSGCYYDCDYNDIFYIIMTIDQLLFDSEIYTDKIYEQIEELYRKLIEKGIPNMIYFQKYCDNIKELLIKRPKDISEQIIEYYKLYKLHVPVHYHMF
jgi:hypothetical protein